MHTGSHYKLKEFLVWTKVNIFILVLISTIPTVLFAVFGWHWLGIPWVPVALVGTGAAFIVGFKNTQTYNRLWEARQIWGAVVNSSRSWGIMVRDFIQSGDATADAEVHRTLVYRHIAWLTALRYQLRSPRSWENQNKSYNVEYHRHFKVPEQQMPFAEAVRPYLSEAEFAQVQHRANPATQIIAIQSEQLRLLNRNGSLENYRFVELERRLADLYEQQGRSERIKNFPYPRQFASINLFFIWIFVCILPFGMLNEFNKIGDYCVWFTIPFSVLVSWIFTSMEQVGESTENPFEGGPNDVPITALSRSIEIDLREMLNESDLPKPITPVNNILM
ncbi:MAG: bestrophin family protein [Flavobacteriales bacterium]